MDNDDELLGLAEFAVEEFYKNQYEEKNITKMMSWLNLQPGTC